MEEETINKEEGWVIAEVVTITTEQSEAMMSLPNLAEGDTTTIMKNQTLEVATLVADKEECIVMIQM